MGGCLNQTTKAKSVPQSRGPAIERKDTVAATGIALRKKVMRRKDKPID